MTFLFLDLPFFIEVSLAVSLLKFAVLVKTRPYRMAIHNWGICYNAAVVVLAYVWLILEDFFLLTPPTTKLCANALLGGLAGVLAMAGIRAICHAFLNFKDEAKEDPSLDAKNTLSKEKDSNQEKLLDHKKKKTKGSNRRK